MVADERAIFPKRLRSALERAHCSQAQLARAVGRDPSSVSRWVSGAGSPDPETMALIARTLQVSADYLLGLTDEPDPKRVREVSRLLDELHNLLQAIQDDS